jgi:aminomethyltransferase
MTRRGGGGRSGAVNDSANPLLRTPIYAEHVRLGARIVPFAGYEMPVQFKGISEEHKAVRTRAGMFDVSHMGRLLFTGPNAGALIDYVVTTDASKLTDGRAMYTCACNERATILDDLLVYRHTAERWTVVCNASNHAKMAAHFAGLVKDRCEFRDETLQTSLIALQGPKAFEVLGKLGGQGPECAKLVSFGLGPFDFAGAHVTVARTGYTGEDGVEIFVPNEQAAKLWCALLEAGKGLGIEPVGLGARDTLRLEARLSLYGNDIDETTNPLEAGLGWIVKLDKPDFLGKAALVQIKQQGLARKIVGFEMVGRGIARHGYPLQNMAGQVVGVCTSGSPSPTLGKNIGLGYLPADMNKIGTQFKVDCRGKAVEAMIVKTPFYKRAS